jgi:hypothetical protein
MSYRLLNVSLITAAAVLVTQAYAPAEAAKNLNTSRSNIYREATPKGTTGPAAKSTTVKSSKSNSSDRMGGGGGGKGAAGVSNSTDRMGGGGGGKGAAGVSNSTDRMGGGGGGKGGVQLNPQPEPPGRR